VVIMRIFMLLILFVFAVMLFPELHNVCSNVNATGGIDSLISIFPYIFITIVLIVPVYYIAKGR